MTKIWRLETKDGGHGPWRPRGAHNHINMQLLTHLAQEEHTNWLVNTMGQDRDVAEDYARERIEYTQCRPSPREEGLLIFAKYQNTHLVCGFTSLRQFKRWFTSRTFRRIASQNGYVLRCYETSEHYDTKWQAVFNRASATIIAERPPSQC